MNVEPEQRAALLGEYIAEHSATVRAAARAFGVRFCFLYYTAFTIKFRYTCFDFCVISHPILHNCPPKHRPGAVVLAPCPVLRYDYDSICSIYNVINRPGGGTRRSRAGG